ncbi:MAG: peptidase S55 SpoIVB [Spirochaetes bacterium]|nr:peptidase S55 SpoIVB [Spirochaetota bacterium]
MKQLLLFLFIAGSAIAADIILPDALTEGMQGVGYTVIHGTNIEPFNVTVLGVLKKARGRSDAILVKVDGLNLDKSGIIAGMSGSPVYFNGKLAGAVSFGWAYNKEASGGVTPIADMLKIYDRHTAEDSRTGYYFDAKPETKRTADARVRTSDGMNTSAPLMLSGFNQEVIDLYHDNFRNMGFIPLIGGGTVKAASNAAESRTFAPGDACAIKLMEGDLNASGIGTVTATDDKRFLLFGHSMFMKGRLEAPVSKAYIHAVIPSQQISFKLGTAYGDVLGYTVFDGELGVSGEYGKKDIDMIPVTFTVAKGGLTNSTRVRIIRDASVFPDMLASSLLAVLSAEGTGEEATVHAAITIQSSYGKPLIMTNLYLTYKSRDAYKAAAQDLLYPVQMFIFNRFRKLDIKGVTVDVAVRDDLAYTSVEEVTADKSEYHRGDTMQLNIGLRPNQGERGYRTMTLTIPANVRPGTYTVYVGGDGSYDQFQRTFFPALFSVKSIDDIYTMLSRPLDPRALNVWMYVSVKGLVMKGREFELLPASYYGILSKEMTSEKAAVMNVTRSTAAAPAIVNGSDMLSIRIVDDE